MDAYFKEKYASLPRPKSWMPGPAPSWSFLHPNDRFLTVSRLKNCIKNWELHRDGLGFSNQGELPDSALENLGDNDSKFVPASVLVPFICPVPNEEQDRVIESVVVLTRSMTVSHHKGQVSFPGGMFESRDQNLVETALRETEEEIGIDRNNFSVLGTGLGVSTRAKNSQVTPVLALCSKDILEDTVKSEDEVDEIHEISISSLCEPGSYFSEVWDFGDLSPTIHMYFVYDTNGLPVFIWGATAHILTDILHCLNNKLVY